MEEMAISKFKARCLAVIERIRQTGQPVLITKFGVPVAEVGPPPAPARPKGWMGSMQGTARIVGDIVAPAADEDQWEALHRPEPGAGP